MSFATLAWARDARTGSPARKALLLVLAEYADESDSCYPSQATLAEATEQSVRTVRSQLADLEGVGLIRRERRDRADGGRTSDRYHLLVDPPADVAAPPGDPLPDPPGARAPEAPGSLLPGNSQSEQPSDQPTTRASEAELLAAGFERFWNEYPRKSAKGTARGAWPKAVRAAGGMVDIIAGAERFAGDPNRVDRFTPHAATWLNGERWNDPGLPARGDQRQVANRGNVDQDRGATTGRVAL